MTLLSEQLGTKHFQLSTIGVGALAVGLQDIKQCMSNILLTIPGTDPLRPLFGCYAYQYMDAPITVSVPNIKKEVFEALSIWEDRIEVTEIGHQFNTDGRTDYTIKFRVIDDDLIASIVYSSDGTVTTGPGSSPGDATIISAAIPAKVENGYYTIELITDDKVAYPLFPGEGYAELTSLMTWLNANWFPYGKWYNTADTLYLYLADTTIKKVSLKVKQIVKLTLFASIPNPGLDTYYHLQFIVDGTPAQPAFPGNEINTAGALLTWLNNNWDTYGSWTIRSDGGSLNEPGDFSADWATDFKNSGGVVENRTLIFQTEKISTATLRFI